VKGIEAWIGVTSVLRASIPTFVAKDINVYDSDRDS
jgi:hypothetical protein